MGVVVEEDDDDVSVFSCSVVAGSLLLGERSICLSLPPLRRLLSFVGERLVDLDSSDVMDAVMLSESKLTVRLLLRRKLRLLDSFVGEPSFSDLERRFLIDRSMIADG